MKLILLYYNGYKFRIIYEADTRELDWDLLTLAREYYFGIVAI